MSNLFWKNFYLCFSTFKSPPPPLSPPSPSQQDHHHPPSTLLINTFNSLYDLTSHSFTSSAADDTSSSSSSSCDTDNHRSPPDLAAAIASHRFFSSSPGPSNSIFDSPDSPPPPLPNGGVAVHTYSPDPYSDFRRSMQEMVEARDLTDVKADWDFLHELLLCYLRLNPKHAHKFILRAFADLLVSLMPLTVSEESCRKTLDRRHCPVSRRLFYV
ncbi:hypothetical protein RJ639_029018 [Escallonia herrerae]|uniref:Transcription repressor n=1 Tax=Escallonia herrerae TaxID=1293975 RepID=A0AA88X610_9ASTE|nr:hypothetical protein RJ639_029018 [Escallonia herrerae]